MRGCEPLERRKNMEKFCGYMGWGFRVDREGNLHDAFPLLGDQEQTCWPRTPWHVKIRHPKKRLGRGKRLLKGTLSAGKRLVQACRPYRVATLIAPPRLGRA